MSQPQSSPQWSPSQPSPSNSRVYLIVIVVLLVALVLTSGISAYLYAAQSSNLNSQIQRSSDLNNQNSNLQNQIDQLKTQVNTLQSQVNNLRSELSNTVNVTYLSGTVTVSSSTPVSIIFYSGSSNAPSASSAVYTDNSYFVVVNNAVSFTVVIVYVSSGIIFHCNATPYVYNSPSGASTSATQNFFC